MEKKDDLQDDLFKESKPQQIQTLNFSPENIANILADCNETGGFLPQIILLIDRSLSMGHKDFGYYRYVLLNCFLDRFLRGMASKAKSKIRILRYLFSRKMSSPIEQIFDPETQKDSTKLKELYQALRLHSSEFNTGTSLYDSVGAIASEYLNYPAPCVFITMTDGVDNTSTRYSAQGANSSIGSFISRQNRFFLLFGQDISWLNTGAANMIANTIPQDNSPNAERINEYITEKLINDGRLPTGAEISRLLDPNPFQAPSVFGQKGRVDSRNTATVENSSNIQILRYFETNADVCVESVCDTFEEKNKSADQQTEVKNAGDEVFGESLQDPNDSGNEDEHNPGQPEEHKEEDLDDISEESEISEGTNINHAGKVDYANNPEFYSYAEPDDSDDEKNEDRDEG